MTISEESAWRKRIKMQRIELRRLNAALRVNQLVLKLQTETISRLSREVGDLLQKQFKEKA